MSTKIEWTDQTWNPIIGCSKISPGCENCYAEKMATRLSGMPITKHDYSQVIKNGKWNNGTVVFRPQSLENPLHWKNTRKVFVCSMGDLFHESVPFEWIEGVFDIIEQTPKHIYQILTKRPERMKEFFSWYSANPRKSFSLHNDWTLKNVWLGVTAENQEQADNRIPILLDIPAKVRFVSVEPMLGSIDLFFYLPIMEPSTGNSLDWVICGPETGPKARPIQKEWIENLYNQCKDANVPFFDKKDILGLGLKEFPKV